MELKRVVITGIGTINPIGNNIPEYFDNLVAGKSGADWITRFDASLFKTRFACEIKGYSPEKFGLDKKESRRNDLFTQYALVASDEAIRDSHLDLDALDKDRAGVIVGSGIGGVETLFKEIKDYCDGGYEPRFSPFLVPMMIPDIAAGMISIKYGFRGPNYATVSACSTSNHAMSDAFAMIRLGKADVMITGGSEAPITIPSIGGFNSAKAISTNNEEYKTASRPFDRTRDGFVMGEGAGILVIESYEHALSRGADILAEVKGFASTSDAYHMTAPDPKGDGGARCMQMSLDNGGLNIEDIDYINAHGTSTPLNDKFETMAIKSVFKEKAYDLSINSTKSMTGHLLGAAGSIEAIAVIMALKEGFIPPTINYATSDDGLDLDYTPNVGKSRNIKYGLSNSLGFGGHNGTILFKKYE